MACMETSHDQSEGRISFYIHLWKYYRQYYYTLNFLMQYIYFACDTGGFQIWPARRRVTTNQKDGSVLIFTSGNTRQYYYTLNLNLLMRYIYFACDTGGFQI